MPKRAAALKASEAISASVNFLDGASSAGASAVRPLASSASAASIVARYGDGTPSQSVTPSKVAAADSAGLVTRGDSTTRATPELYTAGPAVRGKDGRLTFPGGPSSFRPNLTPEDVLRAGAFGGYYYRPLASGALKRVIVDQHLELPASWIAGLHPRRLTALRKDASQNKYGVDCGQDVAAWEESGWISDFDPLGWFQWYTRYFQGRRCADDPRQISRWSKLAGATGRWKNNLIAKCVRAGAAFDDPTISPVVRQTLLHWAYELTPDDFSAYAKKVRAGASTSFVGIVAPKVKPEAAATKAKKRARE